MIEHDVDAQIVASMDSSNLRNVLEATPYQAGSVNQLNEGVNLLGLGQDPSAPPGVQPVHQQYVMGQNPQAVGSIAPPTGGMPGVMTPGYQPQTQQPLRISQQQQSPQDIERYRALAFQAAQGRIEAEERAFLQEIANLPESEREMRTLERELEQHQRVNGWLNETIQQERTTIQTQQQQQAKNMWGFITATQFGLPYNNPAIKTALMGANDQQEMQQIAQGLIGLISGNQAQAVTQQQQNGVFAVGGSMGVPAAQQQALQQFEGSGDLSALLGSRGYTGVQW